METMLPLIERLDFTLPDFTRLSWVNEGARQTWEPLLKSIDQAWSDVEWLSICAGFRACSLTRLSMERFIDVAARWTSYGLSALPLQIVGDSNLPYRSTPSKPEPGK